jgi:hypothetical protein
MLELGVVTTDDCLGFFKASEHAPHDVLRTIYTRIQGLDKKTIWNTADEHWLYQAMLLSMHGSWLKRSCINW